MRYFCAAKLVALFRRVWYDGGRIRIDGGILPAGKKGERAMSTLLLRNIRFAVTCDGADRCLEGTDILCRDGLIQEMGPGLAAQADEVIDCTGMLCYPGLVNTHHHLYRRRGRNPGRQRHMHDPGRGGPGPDVQQREDHFRKVGAAVYILFLVRP